MAGFALAAGLALAVAPLPVDPVEVLVSLLWPLAGAWTVASIDRSIGDQVKLSAAAAADNEAAAIKRAYALLAEAARRLAEADRRLEDLQWPDGS
ncbi:MAG: hypothetical protein ACRDWN_01825 [Acidimicrobiales bacterium]